MAKNTTLSVVIPNYNNGRYLAETIESALKASPNSGLDIVVVDDGSSDDSVAVAKSFGNAIRLYQNEVNVGQAHTTNYGLSHANGDYVVILHSDDLLHSNYFSVLAPLLDKYPTAVLAVGERKEIDEHGQSLPSPAPFYNGKYLIPGLAQSKVFLVSGFLPCQVLFRRKIVVGFGGASIGFDVNLDGLLWFKASIFGDTVYTPDLVSSYRRHPDSLTLTYAPTVEHLFEYYSTLKEMFLFADRHNVEIGEIEKQKAFNRISELAVRYATAISGTEEIEPVRRLLQLASAVNPTIVNASAFRNLAQAIDRGQRVKSPALVRQFSYEPPTGSTGVL